MEDKRSNSSGRNNSTNRRTFVGMTTGSILGLALTGSAGAHQSNESNYKGEKKKKTSAEKAEKYRGSNGHVMEVTPENSMSDKEVSEAIDEISEKHGERAALATFPDRAPSRLNKDNQTVSTMMGDGGLTEGVTRVDSWDHSYVVENSINQNISETNHFITLFKTDETDSDGNTVYLWRGYNYSDAKNDLAGKYATKSMTAKVQFRDDNMEFVQYEPDTKEEFGSSGDSISLNLGFAEIGSDFGGGSSGYQQPSPSKIEDGYGEEPPSKYEDEWNPDHSGAQFGYEVGDCITGLATGSFILDTRSSGPRSFWWKTHVDVGLASICSIT
ncbi:hypothetical protein [Natrinema gari]|uniref:hypothetical protein n=1 Tax=Natrinema gari TaxID=419186 RepID=UPI001268D7B4|nr:hypothetical protein [Natrinema gari]